MKTIINFLRFISSRKYREQKWQSDIEFVQYQIETILKEIASMHKILENAPTSLREDLKHNRRLLGIYLEKESELRKKLKK